MGDHPTQSREAHPGPAPEGGKLATVADLAAGMAHEINNPLAVILEAAGWMGDLLDDGGTDRATLDELRRAVEQISRQAGRCRDITRGLLSFARRSAADSETARLDDVVREVAATLGTKAARQGVELVLRLDGDQPARELPALDVQQVLVNLVNNALDALAPGPGRVVISTSGERDQLVLEVADDGPGIPDSVLPRIFEPFFTTKPVGKGTGLGLAICHGIVDALGGSIAVDSPPGGGATFRVTFSGQGPARRPPPSEPEADHPPPAPQRTPVSVLLVDDDADFVAVLAKRLGRRRFVVYTAATGKEAVAHVQAVPIDVVVLDVKLPDMDGLETLAQAKKLAPLVEVILLSGHATAESAISGIKLGAFDFVIKPADLETLVAQIDRARARKARQEQRLMEARITDISRRRL